MDQDNKRHPDGRASVKGLIWRNGVLCVDTACRGKRLSFSTGTTDLQDAVRRMREAQADARAEAAAREVELPPAIRQLLSLPEQDVDLSNRKQGPTRADTKADAGEATTQTNEHWEMRVRGMVDCYRSGEALATAAATYRLSWDYAVRWMLKHRVAWLAEMFERK